MGRSSVLGDYFSQGYQSVPHIIPGVLYPAVAGKLLDSSTSHSGDYGTAQSDDRKYYYTDIKGSKPIRDPRIGTHFGSQRHNTDSIQLLEQETATHGANVYSVDGREWMRAVGSGITQDNKNSGNKLRFGTANEFVEIVGYFNDMNFSLYTESSRSLEYKLDGGTQTTSNFGTASAATPLTGRFVDAGSVINLGLSATLGIHTIKLVMDDPVILLYNIELIAQDTGTTARRSQINIPAQNVVSYGKRFSIGSDTLTNSVHTHYDPFNGFTDGTTTFSSVVDVDTSLGLGTATTWGAAWDKGSSNHIRPFNGGRVVKWIDSDGTIKTSVTMMPRNAQNIGTTASNEITTVNSTNSQTINFSDDAVENSLSEVAKKFHFREFGNGAANGGTGATYADASMLAESNDDIAYVMDDGLTSLFCDDVRADLTKGTFRTDGTDDVYCVTFIGTGFTLTTTSGGITFSSSDDYDFIVDGIVVKSFTSGVTLDEVTTVVQNLPYGTHIFKMLNVANPAGEHMHAKEFTIHQPKRPPIPEHACVIADYMLMADYVKSTNTTQKVDDLSKGIRLQAASRDIFYDRSGGSWDTLGHGSYANAGFLTQIVVAGGNATSLTAKLPYFGFTKGALSARRSTDGCDLAVTATNSSGSLESTNVTVSTRVIPALSANIADITHSSANVYGFFNWEKSDGVLGSNTVSFDDANLTGTYDWMYLSAMEIVTPIHTSHHYTPFETPLLHELIGGDRNMEQTHLICSPDGKTWDEITRNTSYIGNMRVVAEIDSGDTNPASAIILDEWRGLSDGQSTNQKELFNKDFAIGYDRLICLVDGQYEITFGTFTSTTLDDSGWCRLEKNGGRLIEFYAYDVNYNQTGAEAITTLVRGDYIRVLGPMGAHETGFFHIKRV